LRSKISFLFLIEYHSTHQNSAHIHGLFIGFEHVDVFACLQSGQLQGELAATLVHNDFSKAIRPVFAYLMQKQLSCA
jgi:hypothetical protein